MVKLFPDRYEDTMPSFIALCKEIPEFFCLWVLLIVFEAGEQVISCHMLLMAASFSFLIILWTLTVVKLAVCLIDKRMNTSGIIFATFVILLMSFVLCSHFQQIVNCAWYVWDIIRRTGFFFHTFISQSSSTPISFIWGLDLDGSLQGAGGVGGLLAVLRDDGTYLSTYDANGNISEYVSTDDGSIAAHYEYSPFGELLIEEGDLSDTFTHRFSTKPYCSITKLCEYQMRKYKPEIGRWLSRDPIGEEDATFYAYCINNTISLIDNLGYTWKIKREGRPYAIAVATDESDSFSSLAIELKLDDEDYAKWAHTNDPNPEVCKEYKIPNTIYYHNGHNKLRDTIFASILASWRRSNRKASGEERSQGYMVIWEDNVSDSAIQHALGDEYLYSYTFTGHGSEGAIINAYKEEGVMPLRYTKYGIQSLILQACCSAEKDPIAGRKFHKYNEWEHNVSRRGYFVGYVGAVHSLNELFLWRITKGTNNYGP